MSSWAQWSPLMLKPPTGGASAWATVLSPSRSSRAGVVATAGEASTGCAPRTTSTVSSAGPGRHGFLHGLPAGGDRAPISADVPPTTPLSPSPFPARCTPSSGPVSASATSSWSPAAGRSGSAWSWAPWPSPRPTWSPSTSSTPSSRWPGCAGRTSLSTWPGRPVRRCRQPHRRRRRRRLPRGQRPRRCRRAGFAAPAQARYLCRVRRFGSEVTVDWSIISDDKELDVRGAHLGPTAGRRRSGCSSRGSPMDRICSHQLPLARFQEGLDLVSDGSRSMKVSLIPE